jgi:hypothetical protein
MPKPLPPLNAAWRLFGSKNPGVNQALPIIAREFTYYIVSRYRLENRNENGLARTTDHSRSDFAAGTFSAALHFGG